MKTLVVSLLATAALVACSSFSAQHDSADAEQGPSTFTRAADGVLIGPNGHSLYFYTVDQVDSGESACYEQCAVNWPPLEVADSPTVQPLGDYSIIERQDGVQQWAFQGKPLYYFAKDVKAGDRLGDGVNGVWLLARPEAR